MRQRKPATPGSARVSDASWDAVKQVTGPAVQGLEPAPWYDLVSVVQYPDIDHELAMAYGDAFSLDEVGAFQLADFAKRCKVDRRLLRREATRLAKLAIEHAPAQALVGDYVDEERPFARRLCDFITGQAGRLTTLAVYASKIKDEYL